MYEEVDEDGWVAADGEGCTTAVEIDKGKSEVGLVLVRFDRDDDAVEAGRFLGVLSVFADRLIGMIQGDKTRTPKRS